MRVVEVSVFLLLSGALHVAALTLSPPTSGGSGGGDQGANDVTLQAATPTLAALVAAWEAPPEVSAAPVLQTPQTSESTYAPKPDSPVVPIALPDSPTTPTAQPTLPTVDSRLPAPVTPFAQTEPTALSVPALPAMPALPNPTAPTADPNRSGANQPQLPQIAAVALPKVDTTAPAPRFAPQASLRPERRPDRPQIAQNPAQTNPAPKKPQSAAQPAQKAKGSGQKPVAKQAPARKAPAASGPSKSQLASAQKQWGARITAAVRRAHRPPRGTRASGTVKLIISVSPAGRLTGVSMAQSSGNAKLDQAALAAVKRARLPRAPKTLTQSSYRFSQRLTVSR